MGGFIGTEAASQIVNIGKAVTFKNPDGQISPLSHLTAYINRGVFSDWYFTDPLPKTIQLNIDSALNSASPYFHWLSDIE